MQLNDSQAKTENNKIHNVFIRVNGGQNIGMGHVSRTLTLAKVLEVSYKIRVCFITNNNKAVKALLDHSGFAYSTLDVPTEIVYVIQKFEVDSILGCIFDTQSDVSEEIRLFKDSGISIILLLNKTHARYLADLNIYPLAHFNFMALGWHNYNGKVIGGGEYIPFTEAFLKRRNSITLNPDRDTILVTMGGADPNKLTIKVMSALRDLNGVKVVVVLGHACTYKKEVHHWNNHYHNKFEIIENACNMDQLISSAGLAITAIGITIYELGLLGVPAIVISNFEYDYPDELELAKLGNVLALGFHKKVTCDVIYQSVKELWFDEGRRMTMSNCAYKITDGNGANRICSEIVKYTQSN